MYQALRPMHDFIPQDAYAAYLGETAKLYGNFKGSLPESERQKMEAFKRAPAGGGGKYPPTKEHSAEADARLDMARALIRAQVEAYDKAGKYSKAGVTTSIGYNFFDLRAPVLLAYPVNTPFRNTMPREPRVNAGYGTAAHWMATRDPGEQYAGVPEGQRNAIATPDKNDYVATYKELGIERAVTFTAQAAGEGFADNVADEHLRGLHELWLAEEGMLLNGNSGTGTGNNGFALGQATTPTLGAATTPSGIANLTNVSVFVVFISAMGFPNNAQYGYAAPPTVAGGLTPSFQRVSAQGETVTVNGGTSQISAASAVQAASTTNGTFTATVVPKKGTAAYAWYVNSTDASSPTLANAKLAAITSVPTFTFNSLPSAGNQAGNATGLNTDHSFEVKDFDGMLTYAANSGFVKDLAGASLTSGKDGTCVEVETALQSLFDQFQSTIDGIWCASDTRVALDKCIRYAGTGTSAYRFDYARDSQNNLMGGYVVSAYQSKFAMNPQGGQAIPINLHPMIPKGMIFFDVNSNPYPHSRAPFVRGMLTQRDYYSIEWPVVTRQWTFGTYAHQAMQHNFPWLTALITGSGAFNSSQ